LKKVQQMKDFINVSKIVTAVTEGLKY